MMREPTGSKMPLAMACPASFALPWIDRSPGEPAFRGKVAHRYLENVSGIGREAALEAAPADMRPYLRAIDLDALPIGLQAEAAFAYDWKNRTARYLGTGLERAYPPKQSTEEIFLTVDILGISGDAVAVDDYKTGRSRFGRPAEFAQTMLGALAAARAFDRDEARVGLIYIDDQGEAHPVRDRVDGWALDAFADAVQRAMIEIDLARLTVMSGGTPEVRPGPHCVGLHCPAYRACPNTSAMVRHMPEHVAEVQKPGYLAPTRLAKTWHQIQQVRKIIDEVEQDIRRLSFAEPIDLGDGYLLGPVERSVETFDAKVAQQVVARHLGAEAAEGIVTIETTKAAIEAQAAAWRDARNGKYEDGRRIVLESKLKRNGLLDQIHDEIRREGGAKITTTTNPTRYRKKELP